jgi:dTMP kinase
VPKLRQALDGSRDWAADVMQLLYIANRYEARPLVERELARGVIVICDRYVASSIAYGETQGLDAAWLRDVQRHLPQPDLTFLLDIAPDVSARRKAAGRDRYERDMELLARVRDSYLRQAAAGGWIRLDADRDRAEIALEVFDAVRRRL